MKTTKLHLVRHAVVTANKGKLYGQEDLPCDTSDTAKLAFLAERLPRGSTWVKSNLLRTLQTANAIAETGRFELPELITEADLAEQSFGQWQGQMWEDIQANSEEVIQEFWRRPATICPPDGESFEDLRNRVTPVVKRLLKNHAGKELVLSIHGGTIRAILAMALDIDSHKAVNISIANLSLSSLTHFDLGDGEEAWRIEGINLL